MFVMRVQHDRGPGEQFRLLKWGEVILLGDEAFIDGQWAPTCTCGVGLVWHDGNPPHPRSSAPRGFVPHRRRRDGFPPAFAPLMMTLELA